MIDIPFSNSIIIYLAFLFMQVHRDISKLPFFKNAVITIGTFDGVHTGHLQIIQQLKKKRNEWKVIRLLSLFIRIHE